MTNQDIAMLSLDVEEKSADLRLEKQNSRKKLYASPKFVVYGSLLKLTKGGMGSEFDGVFGLMFMRLG